MLDAEQPPSGSGRVFSKTLRESSPENTVSLWQRCAALFVKNKSVKDQTSVFEENGNRSDTVADSFRDPRELEIQENVAQLGAMEAYDIMVPRADIIALDIEESVENTLRTIRVNSHSRYPVYHNTLDDIAGYVQVKKMLDFLSCGKLQHIEKAMEKPLFIVGAMRVMDLLVQMRTTKVYLALVVDEYGGIDGLVTIEDVMEAILGTLEKGSNSKNPQMILQPNGSYVVDARTELEDFEETFAVTLELDNEERDEVDTVGGLVSMIAGRVPARGEIIRYNHTFEFEVLDADPRRVKWLRVTRQQKTATVTPLVKNKATAALAAE